MEVMMKYCPTCRAPDGDTPDESRVARWMLQKIAAAGPSGLSNRTLFINCASRDRRSLRSALEEAIKTGVVVRDGSSLRVRPER